MTGLLLAFVLGPAHAVDVYVNGVLVSGLKDQVLEEVTVTFDASGDVYIDAPQVRIGRSGSEPRTVEPAQPPVVATDVPLGRWWLVARDTGSTGGEIDVRVNGVLVRVIRSGEPQVLVDLAPFLHRGENQVTFTARATGPVTGDPLQVWVGAGSNDGGMLELGRPEITFSPGEQDLAVGITQVYTLVID